MAAAPRTHGTQKPERIRPQPRSRCRARAPPPVGSLSTAFPRPPLLPANRRGRTPAAVKGRAAAACRPQRGLGRRMAAPRPPAARADPRRHRPQPAEPGAARRKGGWLAAPPRLSGRATGGHGGPTERRTHRGARRNAAPPLPLRCRRPREGWGGGRPAPPAA